MTKEKIKEIYRQYRNNQKKSMEIEDSLLNVSSEDEWMEKLSKKSAFLRAAYRENEMMLEEYIRPIIRREQALSVEEAKEFLNQIMEMAKETENDTLLTMEMLIVLKAFFAENQLVAEEILSTFFLGISYADKVNKDYMPRAYECFEKVCGFGEFYCDIKDWEIRRRILFSYYNRLTNFYQERTEDKWKLLQIWEETEAFCSREDVRALDCENIDFEEFQEECRNSVQWSLACSEEKQPAHIAAYMKKHFLSDAVTEENFTRQKSIAALSYIWYLYQTGVIGSNKTVQLLYCYYSENEKTIDYSQTDFYDAEEYQTQIAFMQECFRYLALPDCDMPQKEEIKNSLLADFKRLYESVPYLDNNSYLNADMIEIMNLLLRLVEDEKEAFLYIREVIIRRNTMTLIHSAMLAKITELIMEALVREKPELFFAFLNTDRVEKVKESSAYLKEYIRNASYIHDIGKTSISDIINLQTRRLTGEEFAMIKRHPAYGAKFLEKTFLAEKYGDIVLGHHKFYDGSGGYPDCFDNCGSSQKIMIDIVTIGDCIDAATDMLGRNYTTGKAWQPTVREELAGDFAHRYNQEIVNVICSDKEINDTIQYITGAGRERIYYEVYRKYLDK